MLRDAKPRAVVSRRAIPPFEVPAGAIAVYVDTERTSAAGTLGAVSADDVACISYDTESFGIAVSHGALVARVAARKRLRRQDRKMLCLRLSDSQLLEELFATWADGATVCFVRPEDGGASLLRRLREERVELLVLDALTLVDLAEAAAREVGPIALPLRQIHCTGDMPKITPDVRLLLAQLSWGGLEAYGRTTDEATNEDDISRALSEMRNASPVANTRCYVLGARGEPAEVGVPGELHLGGAGLALGYPNRPGLTAERFVPDPFGHRGGRLVRTGVRARWRADGTLDILGETDSGALQVVDRPTIAKHMRREARTDIERAIAEIWSEVLGIDCPDLDHDFFELGGHSLLATQIMTRIRRYLNVELPLRTLFESPTIAGLAEAIDNRPRTT
jgi:non-ribosomal peptide synthetase component F/acyl carrier protein